MDTNRPTGPTGSPVTLTPATSPDTRRRLHRQALKILDLLRMRPVWNYEMAQIALSYTRRLSDLRAYGYRVEIITRDECGANLYGIPGQYGTASKAAV